MKNKIKKFCSMIEQNTRRSLMIALIIIFSLWGGLLAVTGQNLFQGGTISGSILAPDTTSCTANTIPYSFSNGNNYGMYKNGSSGVGICYSGQPTIYFTNSGLITINTNLSLGKLTPGTSGVGFSRLFLSGGTSLVIGDVGTISAGCGSTASISAVSGDDSRGTVSLTSAGVGQAANTCTFTLTFHDGTFTNAPFVSAGVTGTLPAVPVAVNVLSSTATTTVFEIIGTPVAASVYTFWFNAIG